ncbi:Lin0512 family protein [Pseudodesulfovibrio indicus]|uniref:Lin0512 family protein n=1 Tax=Pseudodesulfovibrio indicus TaxID=1716143 RepID=UPI00292E75F3|nr:Lin0512 family protein [Pseudodesulfovibrio indicus]
MARQRFAIELGYAADLHGEDMTKAAVRAVRDAVSRVCLCGIMEICGRDRFQGVFVHADVAVPDPERVDREAVLACIPIGETSLNLVPGGMSVPGIEVPCFAPGVSNIVVACAALTVSVETDTEGAADGSKKPACGCAAKAD